jgi:hypothetical protein
MDSAGIAWFDSEKERVAASPTLPCGAIRERQRQRQIWWSLEQVQLLRRRCLVLPVTVWRRLWLRRFHIRRTRE